MIPADFIRYTENRVKFIEAEAKVTQRNTALICATIANFALKTKPKHYRPEDFLPREVMTDEDMLKTVENLNRLFGGEDLRQKRGE